MVDGLGCLGDCYEAFAIASFFTLMCFFIAPDLRRQKEYFVTMTVHPWPWPGKKMRQPRNGLTWFNVGDLFEPSGPDY